MDVDSQLGARFITSGRSSSGCWTCRLRRKKCDELRPVCDACAALHITCNYDSEKPEWMDGGVKQQEKAEELKREVKEKAGRRRRGTGAAGTAAASTGERTVQRSNSSTLSSRLRSSDVNISTVDQLASSPEFLSDSTEQRPAAYLRWQQKSQCAFAGPDACGRMETILLTFYLDHLLPFLFPFYRPCPLHGGKAWILEMMSRSPVVRQAMLCQSSYFYSLAQGSPDNRDAVWDGMLNQTKDAFEVLRQSLEVIENSSVTEHMHGTVRVMSGIMQVQRFEIAILSFNNCRAHLNAAQDLFRRLLESTVELDTAVSKEPTFASVIDRLGPAPFILPTQTVPVPSAEQAAFRFSTSLLILDDIVASTVLQEQPLLYGHHRCLLLGTDSRPPYIDLAEVIGCQNWAMLHIGEIAALDAWKQQRKRLGSLDVMELVRRATSIKESLQAHLNTEGSQQTETQQQPTTAFRERLNTSLFAAVDSGFEHLTPPAAGQSSLVTQVWAHAAILYLLVVVSGWQPANPEVRYHVGQVVELLTERISPPSLLRSMVWPFCVAGCLAGMSMEAHLRGMVEALQPPSVFGTVRKALEIMESAWLARNSCDVASRDLATCFRSQGDLVLLV